MARCLTRRSRGIVLVGSQSAGLGPSRIQQISQAAVGETDCATRIDSVFTRKQPGSKLLNGS